jgi:hypothetical protein
MVSIWNDISEIQECLRRRMKEWKVPGLSLVIIKDGDAIHSNGYNFEITRESSANISIGIGILADQEIVDIDSPAKKICLSFSYII